MLSDYRLALEQLEARLETVNAALGTLAQEAPFRQPVGWLRCFRGIDTLTAITLVAELHDVRRFTSARALMAYVGLVPSEHASGETRRRGGITKLKSGTRMPGAWWSRPPGTIATRRRSARRCAAAGRANPPR